MLCSWVIPKQGNILDSPSKTILTSIREGFGIVVFFFTIEIKWTGKALPWYGILCYAVFSDVLGFDHDLPYFRGIIRMVASCRAYFKERKLNETRNFSIELSKFVSNLHTSWRIWHILKKSRAMNFDFKNHLNLARNYKIKQKLKPLTERKNLLFQFYFYFIFQQFQLNKRYHHLLLLHGTFYIQDQNLEHYEPTYI